jgi:hypothetical protein
MMDPIATDEPIIEWPEGVARDDMVRMLSQAVDAAATVGHDCPYDGPQLVAWLESPVRQERTLASAHINMLRQTVQSLATSGNRATMGGRGTTRRDTR